MSLSKLAITVFIFSICILGANLNDQQTTTGIKVDPKLGVTARQAKKALCQFVTLSIEKESLGEWLKSIRKDYGLNIVIDQSALDDSLNDNSKMTVEVKDVPLQTASQIYSAKSLARNKDAQKELVNGIKETINPDQWNDASGEQRISFVAGNLIVLASQDTHQKLEQLLADLAAL